MSETEDDTMSLFDEEPRLAIPPAPPAPVEHRRPRTLAVLSAILAGVLLLGSGVGLGWGLTRRSGPSAPTSAGRADTGLNAQGVANKVDSAVVDITTFTSGIFGLPIGSGSAGGTRPLGAGTGMIVTSTGEVLTNNHVVDGATRIAVTIPNRSGTYTARVIGVDTADDVALLKIQGVSGLPTVSLADSSSLDVGQDVVAIGNALGQGGSPTVTSGTITSLDRSITVGDERGGFEHLRGLIQTDAPISPGDSGGPLVNSAGQVIGIITASARGQFDAQQPSGIGFAIPVDRALGIVRQIRSGRGGSSIVIGEPGFIGVQVRDLDATTASQLGLPVHSGALVVSVVPGTPAAGAGITAGSVITAVDGARIASADALGPALHIHRPGDRVTLTWVDANGTHSTAVHLVSGPAV